jgi:hypothetical protein
MVVRLVPRLVHIGRRQTRESNEILSASPPRKIELSSIIKLTAPPC